MRMTGAQAIVQALKNENVDVIFGYPGGAVLPIYDVLFDAGIRHILTRHEQGAAHAADGYARATGRPGVCIATSGPGATNLVTGLATAYMDSIPVVALTGQVATPYIGRDSFQEADITGITMPITKHNYLIKDVSELPRVIKEAFYLACNGRPGPVLIDLPKDVTIKELDFNYPKTLNLESYKPTYNGHVKMIQQAAGCINASQRPVIFAGGGVVASGAHEELLKLAEKARIPVTTSLMGMGVMPVTHELCLGMPGMHGTAYSNFAITECDLLIGIGVRFDDRVTGTIEEFAPRAKVIHIDIDPAEIGKNVAVDVPIVGDARSVLRALIPAVNEVRERRWCTQIKQWQTAYPLEYDRTSEKIKPQYVVEQIYEVTGGKAIIATEVGQNQMWAAQFFKFNRPRSFISSGGLGTMGYGLPAAIGAQIGRPDELVFDIAGDGSIQMNIQELATAANYNLPVKIAILNNSYLGMVRQWQELFFQKRYAHTDLANNPDFVKIAGGFGVRAFRVDKKDDVRPVLEKALEIDGPVLMDFRIEREENVFPMVPSGQAIHKMIGIREDDKK